MPIQRKYEAETVESSIRMPIDPLTESESPSLVESTAAGRSGLGKTAQLLWQHRRLLFRLVLVGFVAALVLAFLLPKEYQSTLQLMPPDSQNGTRFAMMLGLGGEGGGGGASSNLAANLLGAKNSGDLFIAVLRSRTVGEQIVQRFNLKQVYGDRLTIDALKALANKTTISEEKKSGVVMITVVDRDPYRARDVAQSYAEELNRALTVLDTSAAHKERVFLEDRLKNVRLELDAAAKEFSEFASQNTAINIPEQGKAMVQAAAQLQGELIATQSQLRGLQQIYTSNNVRVRSLSARVAELQHQLEKIGGKEENPDGEESLYPSIRKLPLLGVRYADLFRQNKIEEAVFEVLTKQYELAKVEEAKQTPSVRVLDPADVPERKSWPPRMLIALGGAFLALSLGILWIIGSARWQEIDPSDNRRLLAQELHAHWRVFERQTARRFVAVNSAKSHLLSRFRRNGGSASQQQHDKDDT